jgi:hypothetical protein
MLQLQWLSPTSYTIRTTHILVIVIFASPPLLLKTPTDNTTIVEMDPGSFRTFDVSYYRNLLRRCGLFQSDAALITDAAAG